MPLPVVLRDVVDALDTGSDFVTYINRRTGEIETLASEPFLGDDTEADKELRKTIEADPDFLQLPGEDEIHGWSLMERFADSQTDPDLREDLLDAIRGRGAFRRFKSLVARRGIREAWFAFRGEALTAIAIKLLDENAIPYTR